ncbi:hypothetical protein AAG906_016876 [Vitis piasezkii]
MCSITRHNGGNHTHVIDDDDDDDDDEDVHISDRQQYETFVENKCKPGESARSSDA